jgi:hypothetical protein
MRNYWMRIALGALAIFTVGMIGRALINRVHSGIHGVVEGSGPLSIPLAFIPFRLGGDKLGSLERVTLRRETPSRVTSVELEVELNDSLVARGLAGCRLAANLDSDADGGRGVDIRRGPFGEGNFWCAGKDSASAELVEYGSAVFRPGDVTVPLLLPPDLVDELQDLDLGDESSPPISKVEAESILAATKAIRESALVVRSQADSLRREGRRRADSARSVLIRVADSSQAR